jgi:D-arabinose 1-dehydrogenase-like Zn-dependent alcohol dehydrogenase
MSKKNKHDNGKLIGMNYPGAFVKFITIQEKNPIPLPDGMNPVHAASHRTCGNLASRSLSC